MNLREIIHRRMLGATFITCGILFLLPTVHPKLKQDILGDKVQQLVSWSERRPVIHMTGDKFINYVKNKPRNYSVVILFTALQAKRGCAVCRDANQEYQILANSFRHSQSYSSKLFFGLVDFDEGSDVFQMMKLSSVPVFMHFPAKGKRKPADTYDIQRLGYQADSLAKWVAERTDITIRVLHPPNYTSTVALAFLFILAVGMLYLKRNSMEFMYNKTMWGALSVSTILAMTSGQMWNHIRGPPFIYRNPQTGRTHYIHGGSQGQFVAESYIVMVTYAGIAIGFIALNEVSKLKKDITHRRSAAMVGIVLVALFFSLILSIFRQKHQQYPYSFLIK